MSFTIKQARYFIGVAEHGSFSRAAAELGISQSTLTESIKDLEAHLGVNLFARHGSRPTTLEPLEGTFCQ